MGIDIFGRQYSIYVPADGRNLKTWWDFEDFIENTTATTMGIWTSSYTGTGASVTDVAVEDIKRIGKLRLDSGTTTTGRAGIFLARVSYSKFLFGAGIYTLEADIYIPTLSDGTDTYTLRFGFGDGSGTPTDGAYFRYTDTGTTPNWYRCTVSNTTLTATDTAVAVVAGAWIRLKVVVNADGTSVEYFINGTSVGSNTTNIPTGTGRETTGLCNLVKSAGTTARTVDIDWTWIHIDLSTSR